MRLSHDSLRRLSEAVLMLNGPVVPDMMPARIIGVMKHLMVADFVAVCTHDVAADSGDAFMSLPAHAHLLDLVGHLDDFHRLPGVKTKEYFNLTTPFSLLDFMSLDTFKNSVLYELFYRHVDILHHLNLNLNRSANLQIQINISRKAKVYSENERFMLGLIRPHLMARFDQMAAEHPSHPLFGSASLIARQTWLLCDSHGRVHARSHDADAVLAGAAMRVGASLPVSWMRWFDGRLSRTRDRDETAGLLVGRHPGLIEVFCLPNPVSNEHRFVPVPGDVFTLIRATRPVNGIFAGLPEGAVAARFPGVDLRISYVAGTSSTDVTLVAEVAPLPATPLFDEDGDGVSDVWQALYGVGPVDPDVDSDGDGLSDWKEYLAGTDPHDPASRFAIDDFLKTGDGPGSWGRVSFQAQAGKMYLLEAAPGLAAGDWAGTGMWVLAENSGPLSMDIPVRPFPGKGFFRLAVKDVDRDGDGLTAWEEGVVGTSDLSSGGGGPTGGDGAAAASWLDHNSSGVNPGGPQANLREVDVAWVRIESSAGTATGDLVTVTGTGQWHHLTSWRFDENISPNPVAMRTTLPIPGGRSTVHFLNPGPAELAPRFLTGRIAADGNLWLSARGLTGTGAFAHYSTRGFGGNVPVRVKSYAVAHRAFLTEMSVSRYVVVTPLVATTPGGFRHLRIVTWRVDAQTGAITGVSDSGSLGALAMAALDEDVRLTVTHSGANRYVAGFRNGAGGLSYLRFETNSQGVLLPESIQSAATVQNIRLNGTLMLQNQAAAFMPLPINGGHMAAVREPDSSIRVATMESMNASATGPGVEIGTLLADSTMDLAPLLNGVVQNPPVLTNSSTPVDRTGDATGFATVAGDFNGDGRADLATSAWRRNVGDVSEAGRVYVIPSGPGGLHNQPATLVLEAGANDLAGSPGNEHRFGETLAKGDFNGDGFDDLAIGVPRLDKAALLEVGAVHIVYGSANGLTQPLGNGAAGSRFGERLATGDLDGNGSDELAIFSRGFMSGGRIYLHQGRSIGLAGTAASVLAKGTGWLEGGNPQTAAENPVADDLFGFSMAMADFNGNGRADLAVGVPGRDSANFADCGQLHFFDGTLGPTLVTLANDTVWFPNLFEAVRAMVSDLVREDSHGKGAGRIFGFNENLEWRHIASSTKMMTLLLAVEAIEAGKVSLGDTVEFDEVSGNDGGSNLEVYDLSHNLQQVLDGNGNNARFFADKDIMPMRLVLAAMMNRSCNRSTEAIARHVAERVNGDKLDFLNMMNARAKQLGMTESLFGSAAGGAVSKPQDMITLLAEGRKHPLWLEFGGIETYAPANYPAALFCGTDVDGESKCNGGFPKLMTIGTYPGRVAWKGGNTGFWRQPGEANDIPPFPSVPFSNASGHGLVQRLGRMMGVSLLQSGNRANDAGRLFDYAFRQVFTPDMRAITEYPPPGGIDVIVGPEGPIRVRDFAIDYLFHGYGVTALIDDHEDLRLNIWSLDATANTMDYLGQASRKYALLGNSGFREPRLIDGTPAQASGRRSDFFTANLIGDRLRLQLWRVGDTP